LEKTCVSSALNRTHNPIWDGTGLPLRLDSLNVSSIRDKNEIRDWIGLMFDINDVHGIL
jgi:hypothetical protein